MASVNKVILIGNLTRDPELRVTPKGTPICQFGLAVNRTFKGEDGQSREEVTFVDIEAWGRQGETIAKYLTKGRPLYLEGRLKLDTWDDKESGQKRSKMKVVLENFQFLGSGKGEGGEAATDGGSQTEERHAPTPPRQAPPARPASTPPQRPPARPAPSEQLDEDVPF